MNRAEQHWLEVKIIRNQRLVVVNKNTNLNKEGFKTWSCVHHILSSVKEKLHFSSVTQSCPTLCDPMDCSTPGLPVHPQPGVYSNSYPSSDAIQTYSVVPFSPCLPSIRVFSNELVLHIRWPKYGSFSFSISPSNEYSGLNSFWMDWLDLLAVQGTRKSLLQHHSSKPSILWHSAFFMLQLSHPYMTTGKTIGLTIQTFVGKVMSLLFNTLSRFVIALKKLF